MIDRHHLLECILWPNGDGTFRKIVNTQKRLKELGVYDNHKMTIPIEHGTHSSMHLEFKKGTEYEFSGENHPMYGRTGEKNSMYGKGYLISGEKNGMYGMTGDKNPWYGKGYLQEGDRGPRWKGDEVGPQGAYRRAKKLYKAGRMSEEEFQTYRDACAEYQHKRKATRSHT